MKKLPHAQLYLLVIAFFSSMPATLSQARKSAILQYDTAARPGEVMLADGTHLRGRIVFNDNDGIVTLYNEDKSALRSFNSRDLVRFQFYGREAGRERVFYSMEYDNTVTGLKDMEFFEVLKELDSFVVLVRIERLTTEQRKIVKWANSDTARKQKQTQIVYFMGADGTLEPYLKMLEKEIGGGLLDWDETRNSFINPDLFEKYTGKHFPALTAYAKENKLSFKNKEHIVTILDQYQQLVGKP